MDDWPENERRIPKWKHSRSADESDPMRVERTDTVETSKEGFSFSMKSHAARSASWKKSRGYDQHQVFIRWRGILN